MKIKLIKIFSCLLIMCVCLLAFQIKPKAQSSNTTFEPFELGMTFPVGYEINNNNTNGVYPTKLYSFSGLDTQGGIIKYNVVVEDTNVFNYILYLNNELVFSGVMTYVELGFISEDNFHFTNEYKVTGELELVEIASVGGDGELGIFVENVEEPNVIYDGTYELLANLIYGTTENLTTTQIGTLEFISMLITILCVLLPFIIVFFIVRKLCD